VLTACYRAHAHTDSAPREKAVCLGNGKYPRQYGLDFGLWTQAMIASLIEQKFAVKLGLTAVRELLAKLGLTPQKSLERACQRNPEAIEKWKRDRSDAKK
jgi:transposase